MNWRAAWWLVRKELKFNRISFILSSVALIPVALLVGKELEGLGNFRLGQVGYFNGYLLDYFFMVLVLFFGILFLSGPYLSLRTVKEDPFSKRMALYRTLPIPIQTLTFSRTLAMLTILITMSTVFFGTLFLSLAETFFQAFPKGLFLPFALFWIGISLLGGGFATFIEFGTSGKILFLSSLLYIVFFIMAKLYFYFFVGQDVVEWSLFIIEQFGWKASGLSLFIGGIGCYMWNSILQKRLLKRDYV